MKPTRKSARTSPRYWLLITTRGYWEIMRRTGTWAFAEQHQRRLDEISPGDLGIVYLTSNGGKYGSTIGGIVRLKGGTRRMDKSSVLFDLLYPLKTPFKPVTILDEPVQFKPLIGHVSFIGKGTNWGGSLQGQPIKMLSERDFRTVEEYIKDHLGGEL